MRFIKNNEIDRFDSQWTVIERSKEQNLKQLKTIATIRSVGASNRIKGNWIQYISFEHEIESRKTEYYRALRVCQAQRPNEDITIWIQFFLSSLSNIQSQLMLKLKQNSVETQLSPHEKLILTLIQNYPDIKSGEISEKLAIPNSTVKRILSELKSQNLLESHGKGRNVTYLAK
jgi:Fic family protein